MASWVLNRCRSEMKVSPPEHLKNVKPKLGKYLT